MPRQLEVVLNEETGSLFLLGGKRTVEFLRDYASLQKSLRFICKIFAIEWMH